MSFWLAANWPAPAWIKAGTTCIGSGFSQAPYASLNLAEHVGDNIEQVEQNRNLLQQELHLPAPPLWLKQVHDNTVIESDDWHPGIAADGCTTHKPGIVCAILTADCLPLLLCDEQSRQIAAIHVGWRGLCQNIVDSAISRFSSDHDKILAWTGPHIHQQYYEVGEDVRTACLQACPGVDHAFVRNKKGHWLASLETLVHHQLMNKGISMIFSSNRCTFAQEDNFFSYRRNKVTGRMASLIWMESGKSWTRL